MVKIPRFSLCVPHTVIQIGLEWLFNYGRIMKLWKRRNHNEGPVLLFVPSLACFTCFRSVYSDNSMHSQCPRYRRRLRLDKWKRFSEPPFCTSKAGSLNPLTGLGIPYYSAARIPKGAQINKTRTGCTNIQGRTKKIKQIAVFDTCTWETNSPRVTS